MQEIKPTWWIAHKIIRRHAMIAGLLLLLVMLLGAALVTLILIWRGEAVSLDILREIFMKYRPLFLRFLLLIYLLPINIFAVISALKYKYKGFRVVIYVAAKPERQPAIDKVASLNGRLANDFVDQV